MLRPFKRALDKKTRAGVARDGARLGLAKIRRRDDGTLGLQARVIAAADNNNDWTEHAAAEAEAMAIGRAPVSTVLSADAYQLQLVEMPNVPADEALAAVRWRVKDLIDYPLDEAVVEMFEMPRHANAGSAATAYAVVTRSAEVLRQIETMQRAELQMDVIDIPELCLRNIAARLPQDEEGVAFLHFADDCGYLTVTRRGVLHIVRRIDHGRRSLEEAETDSLMLADRIAGVSLEVQRSLDYYESHYDCRPVAELVLGPGAWPDGFAEALMEHLGISISQLALDALFTMDSELPAEEQADCLLAVGAALRSEPLKSVVATA